METTQPASDDERPSTSHVTRSGMGAGCRVVVLIAALVATVIAGYLLGALQEHIGNEVSHTLRVSLEELRPSSLRGTVPTQGAHSALRHELAQVFGRSEVDRLVQGVQVSP